MRTWVRAMRTRFCGACGHVIERGDAMIDVQLRGISRHLARCAGCAGCPTPDLPPLLERPVTTPMLASMKPLATVIPFALQQWEDGQ